MISPFSYVWAVLVLISVLFCVSTPSFFSFFFFLISWVIVMSLVSSLLLSYSFASFFVCFLNMMCSCCLKLLVMDVLCSMIIDVLHIKQVLCSLVYFYLCPHSSGSIMICWCGSPHPLLAHLPRSLAATCSSADPRTMSFISVNLPSDLVSHLKTH